MFCLNECNTNNCFSIYQQSLTIKNKEFANALRQVSLLGKFNLGKECKKKQTNKDKLLIIVKTQKAEDGKIEVLNGLLHTKFLFGVMNYFEYKEFMSEFLIDEDDIVSAQQNVLRRKQY